MNNLTNSEIKPSQKLFHFKIGGIKKEVKECFNLVLNRSMYYIGDYSKVDILILVARSRTCSAKNSVKFSESSGVVLCLMVT